MSKRSSYVLLVAVFLVAAVGISWSSLHTHTKVLETAALQRAQGRAKVFRAVRSLYSSDVVARAREKGVQASYMYKQIPGAIPIPATFGITLGERLAEGEENNGVQIYSPYPFSGRSTLPLDSFQKEAWQKLSKSPNQPVFSFTSIDGSRVLRYAIAEVMGPSCISCHNSHPQSPKQDWKVGDLRGVFEVSLPVEESAVQARNGAIGVAIVVVVMGVLGGVVLVVLVRNARGQTTKLAAAVDVQTAEIQESGRRLRAIVDSALDCVVSMDAEGNIIEFNPAAEAVFGYSRDEVLGTPLAEAIVPPSLRQSHQDGLARCLATGNPKLLGKRIEIDAMRSDGSLFPVELAITSTEMHGKPVFTAYLRDIADRIAMKEQTEWARQAAETAAKNKDAFLASMSHELRTPLNAVLGMSEALSEEIFGELNEKQKKALATVHSSGKHLLELINQVLDVARINVGKMDLTIEVVGVRDLCAMALEMVRHQAKKKSIELECTIEDTTNTVHGDRLRLKQVLVNLLSNAVKFTPNNGRVSLEVTADGDSVVFTVADTGIGFEPEDADKIFEPFTQLDNELSRNYEGTGLGLALVKEMVELHNGRVSAVGERNKGARISIYLPTRSAEINDGHVDQRRRTGRCQPLLVPDASPLVLLVEDNEVNIEMTTQFLQAKNFRVNVARDGFEAIESAAKQCPDVVLMDVQLPKMDALQATAKLREQKQFNDIPIIMLTASAMQGDRERCLQAGADGYLSKPISLSKLVKTIGEFLDAQEPGRESNTTSG